MNGIFFYEILVMIKSKKFKYKCFVFLM